MIAIEDCSRSQLFLLSACLLACLVYGGCLLEWDRCSALHGAEKRTWSLDQVFFLRHARKGRKRSTRGKLLDVKLGLFKYPTPNPTLCFIKAYNVPFTSCQLSIVQRAIL